MPGVGAVKMATLIPRNDARRCYRDSDCWCFNHAPSKWEEGIDNVLYPCVINWRPLRDVERDELGQDRTDSYPITFHACGGDARRRWFTLAMDLGIENGSSAWEPMQCVVCQRYMLDRWIHIEVAPTAEQVRGGAVTVCRVCMDDRDIAQTPEMQQLRAALHRESDRALTTVELAMPATVHDGQSDDLDDRTRDAMQRQIRASVRDAIRLRINPRRLRDSALLCGDSESMTQSTRARIVDTITRAMPDFAVVDRNVHSIEHMLRSIVAKRPRLYYANHAGLMESESDSSGYMDNNNRNGGDSGGGSPVSMTTRGDTLGDVLRFGFDGAFFNRRRQHELDNDSSADNSSLELISSGRRVSGQMDM